MSQLKTTANQFNEKSVNCKFCRKSFLTEVALQCHIKKHSTFNDDIEELTDPEDDEDNPTKTCIICGMTFSSDLSLLKHRKLHFPDKPKPGLAKPTPKVSNPWEDRLKSKRKRELEKKEEISKNKISKIIDLDSEDEDSKTSPKSDEIVLIEDNSNNGRLKRCSRCGLYFITEVAMEAHIKKKHGSAVIIKEETKNSTENMMETKSLNGHKGEPVFQKYFEDRHDLYAKGTLRAALHMKDIGNDKKKKKKKTKKCDSNNDDDDDSDDNDVVPRRKYCRHCKMSFDDASSLREHQELKHPKDSSTVVDKEPIVVELKFKCKICQSKYPTEASLLSHKAEKHFEAMFDDDGVWDCSFCKRPFLAEKHLLSHIVKEHEILGPEITKIISKKKQK